MKDHVLFIGQLKADSSRDCHKRNISQDFAWTALPVYGHREETELRFLLSLVFLLCYMCSLEMLLKPNGRCSIRAQAAQ